MEETVIEQYCDNSLRCLCCAQTMYLSIFFILERVGLCCGGLCCGVCGVGLLLVVVFFLHCDHGYRLKPFLIIPLLVIVL